MRQQEANVIDFTEVMAELLKGRYADREKVIVVCDHLNTHTKGAFYEAVEPERAFALGGCVEFHYTSKHGSWLNISENELSSMTRQCVSKRRLGDIRTLQRETAAWAEHVSGCERAPTHRGLANAAERRTLQLEERLP